MIHYNSRVIHWWIWSFIFFELSVAFQLSYVCMEYAVGHNITFKKINDKYNKTPNTNVDNTTEQIVTNWSKIISITVKVFELLSKTKRICRVMKSIPVGSPDQKL